MKPKTLQKTEAAKILDGLRPSVDYLCRLHERMKAAGFETNDPIFVSVKQVYEAVRQLSQVMHRRSCEGWGGGQVDR